MIMQGGLRWEHPTRRVSLPTRKPRSDQSARGIRFGRSGACGCVRSCSELTQRIAAIYAARTSFVVNVACVIDTVVPSGVADVSTVAPSCCASALMMPVPSPVFG
jgi:hypothetical protein